MGCFRLTGRGTTNVVSLPVKTVTPENQATRTLVFRLTHLFHPMFRPFAALAFSWVLICTCEATTLPVGPITFSTNADYDSNFKESSSFNGISRNANGYLEVSGVPTATAAFDTSATGGINGQGGTGGGDANIDLSNFAISADIASSVSGGIGAAFLLRLNSAEAGGYVASVHTQGTTAVTFDIGEGASLTSSGAHIFSTTVTLSGLTTAANTFYNFKVTISGGAFSFDFGSGAATTNFTDTTVSATVGQVGILMDTFSPSAATRMKNFAVVPEPTSSCLIILSVVGYLAVAMTAKAAANRT
jgi:hypothetical protein